MAKHRAPPALLTGLPTDVISCIVGHLQQDAWQRDQSPDDVAALRSVCRSLRHAVDLIVTHATIHVNVGAAELRSTLCRFTGLQTVKLPQKHSHTMTETVHMLATLPHLRTLDMPRSRFELMLLQDRTRLSGLTGLTLRGKALSLPGKLVDDLLQLTALRSLAFAESGAPGLPGANVAQLTSLSLLTHLDLGYADGVAWLAPKLTNLESLALHIVSPHTSLSSVMKLSLLTSLKKLAVTSGDNPLSWRERGAGVVVSLCDEASGPGNDVCSPLPPQLAHLPLQGVCCRAALQLAAWLLHIPGRYDQGGVPVGLLPCTALRELRLFAITLTVYGTEQLAKIASRLRVLHPVRCGGALAQLLEAAAGVEDISLQGARFHVTPGGELLAALRPAAGTLRALDITDLDSANELTQGDAGHLAALSELVSLACGLEEGAVDSAAAISQLTRLRHLQLKSPSKFTDAQLGRLSTLRGLTSLAIAGWHEGVTGSWLAALAAARAPLRQLQLCDGAVVSGCGAEAAIGQLTRLTSLHLSVNRYRTAQTATNIPSRQRQPQPSREERPAPLEPMQLQLLGKTGNRSSTSSAAAGQNTSMQVLSLECIGRLTDDELAAAAAALPDLRLLQVAGGSSPGDMMFGVRGTGLAAFGACRRLRDVRLRRALDLRGVELARHLPKIVSLDSVQVAACRRVSKKSTGDLQAAFWAGHGRSLTVVWSAE